MSGTISPHEKQELFSHLRQAKRDENSFDDYYQHQWDNAMNNFNHAPEEKQRVWEQIKIETQLEKPSKVIVLNQKWASMVAMIAFIVVFTGVGLYINSISSSNLKDLVVRVEKGQKSQIELPDGSMVWLNSVSEVSFDPKFGKKNRNIRLKGEAYFEVKSNQDLPFIVQTTNNVNIQALGTKFCVKSYSDDDAIVSTLIEGEIAVSNSSFYEVLKPNQEIIYSKTVNTYKTSTLKDATDVISWLNNELVFDEETLSNIAKTLERMYNVTIEFETNNLKEIKYSGRIKNNSLSNVIRLITRVSPIEYTIEDSIIKIKSKE